MLNAAVGDTSFDSIKFYVLPRRPEHSSDSDYLTVEGGTKISVALLLFPQMNIYWLL